MQLCNAVLGNNKEEAFGKIIRLNYFALLNGKNCFKMKKIKSDLHGNFFKNYFIFDLEVNQINLPISVITVCYSII